MKRMLITSAAMLTLAACSFGPKYSQPNVEAPDTFKESQGWKPANPAQVSSDQPWWSIFTDPDLDGLERQIEVSNQNLKAAEAQYRAARAEVGIARGGLLPSLGVRGSAQRSSRGTIANTGSGGGVVAGSQSGSGGASTTYSIVGTGSWDIDVWGRIRGQVNADVANAQASAADLAAAKLSAQTALASDYFAMRAAEVQSQLLARSVEDFQRSLDIVRNRKAAGIVTEADVAAAQTQLDNATTQQINAALTRAKMEHAIAMLIGKAPAEVTIPPKETMPATVPVTPAGLSTTLLERRPDIAAAERRAAAASAQIGVAIAAWFPDITLTGSYGFASSALGALFSASSATWAYGLAAVGTLFNGGATAAGVQQAHANYDLAVARYRETALTAFQQVEDQLAAARILEREAAMAAQTVEDARRSEQLALNQYKAGVADYTSVVTAETTRLNAEVSALNIATQRLTASVDLIGAIGGGWTTDQLPQPGFFYSLPKTADTAKR